MRATPFLLFAAAHSVAGCVIVTDFGGYSGGNLDAGALEDGRVVPDGGSDGACGPGCGEGETCDDGVCRCGASDACGDGEACCGGACLDVRADPASCGGCGARCESQLNSTATCEASRCVQTCEGGFQDCDASPGCEVPLLHREHCGACGRACAAGELCATIDGAQACVDRCGAGQTACDGACVDTSGDVSHCGGCDTVCPMLPFTTRMCDAGACAYACSGDFVDCNGDLGAPGSDGCEAVLVAAYRDADGDGVGAGPVMRYCPAAVPSGWVGVTGDCDDADPDRFPGNPETCDGVDEDCDGTPDDDLAWMGVPLGGSCACEAGADPGTVTCDGGATPACEFPSERCNGRDDDCDGAADDGFECAAGASESCTVRLGTCTATGTRRCDGLFCTWDDCVTPPETCDGVDDDCDGFVDQAALALGPASPLVADIAILPDIALHPSAGMGGAVVYMLDGASRRLVWQALSEEGRAAGTPAIVATGADLGFPFGLGWDGGQWSVFFPRTTGAGSARHVRVSTSGAVSAEVDLGEGYSVQAASDGSSVGVVTLAHGRALRAGIYRDGAWLRPIADVVSGSFEHWIDVEPTGAGGYVVAGTREDGRVQLRQVDPGSLGTTRSVLTDAALEEIDLAVDPAGRVAIGWNRPTPSSGVSVYQLASGALLGETVHGLNRVRVAFDGADFVAVESDLWRVRSIDGAGYPESYRGASGLGAIARWRGARILYVTGDGGTGTVVQTLGCP